MPASPAPSARSVILFDGVCDLCHTGAEWLRREDRDGTFELLPYQSDEARRRFPALDPDAIARALHVVTPDGDVLVGADAAPWVFGRLPRWRWVARVLALPGIRQFARPAYAYLAARRRLFNRDARCDLTTTGPEA